MLKKFMFLGLFVSSSLIVMGQEVDTSVVRNQFLDEVRYIPNFQLKYDQMRWRLKRAYPLALRAAEIIDSLEMDIQAESRKRKRKKIAKSKKAELKEEFTYILKDLYHVEGQTLFKLIHRETNLTVDEILKKYIGGFTASSARTIFRMSGHNTRSTFDPKSNDRDYITEIVIADIQQGRIFFDMNIEQVDRAKFKQGMKEYRKKRRKAKRK
jgi:hypothetical protein